MADNEVSMMMSVYPGAMTGFAALNSGLVSINNIFMQTIARIDDNFGILNASILATGAVVAQFAADSMMAFGQFEQGMKIVQMVSGQTAEDIGYLSQKANEFSMQYRVDIDQITEGLQTLGRAGLNSASEQAEVLQNGLNTAKLEGRDLNSVLQELIQNTALLGGDLNAPNFGEQSEYVNDLLVATSMTAPITTHDISETLKYSGGIAAAAGAKIDSEQGKDILEDYMATIAAFAQKGVTGSIAGTALRAFLNKPATQDSSVLEGLSAIKLKPEYLWEDDEETMKPISEQISIIQNQMDELNISTMDRLQIWSKIVGGKMGQQMMKLDSSDIKELVGNIREADDATSLAKGSMQTFQANIKEVGEAGARMQRNIGGNLVQIANPFLDIFVKILEFAQNDVMSWPITGGIIAFLGLVATKIRAVFAKLKAEIGTVVSALKAGADMITSRQLKGEKGVRAPLPGEKYTDKDLAKEVTPGSLLKGFREQYQAEAAKSLVGLSKENAAIVEASKGWSKESDYLKKFDTPYVTDDGKSFMQARDNAVIAQLARHNLLTPEVQKAFFTGTKKEEIMSTMLTDGRTVREYIEETFLKLQTELRKTAQVLEEASVAAEESNVVEEEAAAVKKETSEETAQATTQAAERAAEQAATGWKQVNEDFVSMWEGVNSSTVTGAEEVNAQVKTVTETIVMNVTAAADSVMAEFVKMARGISSFNSIPTHTNTKLPGYVSPASNQDLANNMFFSKEGIPLTYSQNLALLFGEQYGNLSEVTKKGFTPFTGQMPWFMQYNTPYDLFKHGPMQFTAPTDAEAEAAAKEVRVKSYHGTPGTHTPHGMDPGMDYTDEMNKFYKNNMKQLPGTGISIESLEEQKEIERQQNLSRVQAGEEILRIDQERLAIEEEILLKERDRAANGAKNKDQLVTQARQQHADQEEAALKSARSIGIGKNVRSTIEENNQLNKLLPTLPKRRSTVTTYKEWALQQEGKNDILEEVNRKTNVKTSTRGIEESYKDYYMKTIGKDGEIRDKQMQTALNTAVARGTQYGNMPDMSRMDMVRNYVSNSSLFHPISAIQGSATYQNLVGRLNRDRMGSFLSFGSEIDKTTGNLRSATTGIKGFANKALNATDAIGGPFMIAIMAASAIIQAWQKAFQDYCEDLKEASDQLKEAYSKWSSAEDSLRRTYQEGNPDATSEEIDQMVYDTYATMNEDMEKALKNKSDDWFNKLNYQTEKKEYEYDEETDDGTTKEKQEELTTEEEYTKALQENTGALYEASNEVVKALSNYTRIAQDTWWGVDGWTGWLTDLFGGFLDKLAHLETSGSTFTENGNEFLLTQSQADENYSGNTEMAGLMLEDFKDAKGNWISGLRTMMGEDVEDMAHLFYKGSSTHKYLKDMAKFSAGQGQGGLSSTQNMKIQKSMQNDPKTWKKLGKELAKRDSNKKANRNIEKNQKRIEGLVGKIRSTVGSGFRDSQILQAAYLYQLQDMKEITDQAIVPIMQTNMVTAAKTLTATGSVDENTGNTVGTTDGTYQNAAIIAGLVAIIAKQSAKGEYFDTALAASRGQDITGDNQVTDADYYWWDVAHQDGMTADKYYAQATKEYNEALNGTSLETSSSKRSGALRNHIDEKSRDKKMEGALGYLRLYETTGKMTGFDYDPKSAAEESRKYAQDVKEGGISLKDAIKTAEKNYTQSESFKQKIVDAYNMSGDDDEGSGGGGGGGSGSGNKDNDNTGTKKERVDLVLCNKKEIPKLNVNLFKKPPTFTVLNKNFKLRDVKINTEDTPKAIMSSIKNAFIDVQKRSDPKIIQDEEGAYDPVEATDGNALPSGTAKTRTD